MTAHRLWGQMFTSQHADKRRSLKTCPLKEGAPLGSGTWGKGGEKGEVGSAVNYSNAPGDMTSTCCKGNPRI